MPAPFDEEITIVRVPLDVSIPSVGITGPEKVAFDTRLDDLEATPIPVNIGDLDDVDTTGATTGDRLVFDGTDWVPDAAPTTTVVFGVNFIIGDGGSVITTGITGDIRIPFACTITEWNLYADQVGSIVVNLWKVQYASFPPTVANAITGSSKPTLTAVNKNADAGLAGWTTAVGAEDIIRINVESASTVQRVTLVLKLSRTI